MQLEIMTPWVRARRVLIAGLSYRMYISAIRLIDHVLSSVLVPPKSLKRTVNNSIVFSRYKQNK